MYQKTSSAKRRPFFQGEISLRVSWCLTITSVPYVWSGGALVKARSDITQLARSLPQVLCLANLFEILIILN